MDSKPVLIMCPDDETAKLVGDALRRISAALSAFDTYTDALDGVDENALGPVFMSQFGPLFERFTRTIINIYPTPGLMKSDIKSFGNFGISTATDFIKRVQKEPTNDKADGL